MNKPCKKDLETPIGELTKRINPSNASAILEVVTGIKNKKIDQEKNTDQRKSKDLQKKPAKNNARVDESGWIYSGEEIDRQIHTVDLS